MNLEAALKEPPTEATNQKPRSGERLQPTAQAVGKPRKKEPAPEGAKEDFSRAKPEARSK
jgi:hypothetical protein